MKFTEIGKHGAQIDYGASKFTLGRVKNALEAFDEYGVQVDFVKHVKSYDPIDYDYDERFIQISMPPLPMGNWTFFADLKYIYKGQSAEYIIEHASDWIRREIEYKKA